MYIILQIPNVNPAGVIEVTYMSDISPCVTHPRGISDIIEVRRILTTAMKRKKYDISDLD